MKHNRFGNGSGAYRCLDCGKLTRDTGKGEAGVELCAKCYEAGLQANAEADFDWPDPDALAALGELQADEMAAAAEEASGHMIALGYPVIE